MAKVVTIGTGFQVRVEALVWISIFKVDRLFSPLVQSSSFTNPFCEIIKLSLISLERDTTHTTHTHSLHIDNIWNAVKIGYFYNVPFV